MQAKIGGDAFIEYLQGLIESPDDLRLHHADYDRAPMEEILRYRDMHYASRNQTYLLSEQQREFEQRSGTDRRSHHLWVTRQDRIVGTMRATPAPHELAYLAPAEVAARGSYPKRLEFGRLVSTASGHDVGVVSKKLIAGACLFGVLHGYEGVIAVCKSPQRRLFERFGLTAIASQFVIRERNEGAYWLVQANWRAIIAAIPPAHFPPTACTNAYAPLQAHTL